LNQIAQLTFTGHQENATTVEPDIIFQTNARKKYQITNQGRQSSIRVITETLVMVISALTDALKARITGKIRKIAINPTLGTDTDQVLHITAGPNIDQTHRTEDHKKDRKIIDKTVLGDSQAQMTDRQTEGSIPPEMTDDHTAPTVNQEVETIVEMIEDHPALQTTETYIDQTTGQIQKTCQLRHGTNNTCHAH
jgi:hypothetical protein